MTTTIERKGKTDRREAATVSLAAIEAAMNQTGGSWEVSHRDSVTKPWQAANLTILHSRGIAPNMQMWF